MLTREVRYVIEYKESEEWFYLNSVRTSDAALARAKSLRKRVIAKQGLRVRKVVKTTVWNTLES